MRLIAVSVAWVGGVYLGSLVSPPLYAFISVFVFSLLIALLWRRKPVFLWTGLCLIVLFAGIGCYHWRVSEATVQSFNDSGNVEIKGEVVRDPEFESGTARLSLSVREIKANGDWEDVSGNVLIYTKSFPSYSLGDWIKVAGELESPTAVENPDYRDYLTQHGFRSTMSYPQIEFMQRGWLYSARNRLSESLSQALPEPQGSLAQALLLGVRSHLPDTLVDSFRSSGTSHLLAISGLHVAMLAGVVLAAAAWLFGRRRPIYLAITFAMVWIYALLTGMQPPVFRAAIMFSLFLTALWLGRPRSAIPSLALAAAIMVGLDPSVLRDVSFQLSFVSIAGIALLLPFLQEIWQKVGASRLEAKEFVLVFSRPIVQSLIVGLAAIIAVYPLIAYYFGYVSVVGLPATILVLLALPGAIVLGLLTAVLGLFAPPLAWVVGWVAWLFLSYIIKMVDGFGHLSFTSYHLGPVSAIAVWAYYGVLVAILSRRPLLMVVSKTASWVRERLGRLPRLFYRPPKKWVVVPLLVAAALVWLAVLATPKNGRLEVSFLDVGQGDAILIQTPSGQQVLIDGGPDPEKICLELGEEMPFWDKSLDMVVLTHPEDDHILGLLEVLRRYRVKQVMEPGFESDNVAYQEWLRLIDEKNITRTVARSGQQIELGDGIRMEVLNPQEEFVEGSDQDANNNCVVVRLIWKEISFLFTGDIGSEAEQQMLYQGAKLEATVLKVAHHGSAGSTSQHFLAAVDPQVAVVCVGADNPFGHPSPDVMERLEIQVTADRVYLTSEGTIKFTTDGKRLWANRAE
jgi:competence protein ComEC